jgi:ER-bound oxygenase mpaB/B'/Rubber oxygenase, catalytic domain
LPAPAWPARFRPDPALRQRSGPTLATLGELLSRKDPLADALAEAFAALPPGRGFALLEHALQHGVAAIPDAPEPLRALMAAVDEVPVWVDRDRQNRGGALVLRAGIAAGVVLGMKSLMLGYASPGGNKPLAFSGRLRQQAARRLAETSRFVQAVSQPGGMARLAPGFAITVKVRLMHAEVRRLIERSGRWQPELWGAPINQHDMLATALLFSVALVDGLRTLGYAVEADEADDVVHLWRQVGLVMGVAPDVLPESYADGWRLAKLIRDTQGPPDEDGRQLAAALFAARADIVRREVADPRGVDVRIAAMHAVTRRLLGDDVADGLGIPRPKLAALARVLWPVAQLASRVNRLPFVRALAERAGDRYWDLAVAEGLGDRPARYQPPERLAIQSRPG